MAVRRRYILLSIAVIVFFLFLRNRQLLVDPPEVLRVQGVAKEKTPTINQLSPDFPKISGSNYTKTLVITRTKNEDVSWVEDKLRDVLPAGTLQTAVYTVDDRSAPLRPPANKGHEVMVYLTYIIDRYDDLSDVNIFMHSHQLAWHNNELMELDAVEMLSRLNLEFIQSQGYVNLRCHWIPGCPEWMHPATARESYGKKEEIYVAKSWSELFPLNPMPDVLAQPCCSQFALSKDQIRSIPLERFIFYRNWLLHTKLEDSISGRVWEYIWHFVFTGQTISCPEEFICYCATYSICFEDEEAYKAWFKLWDRRRIAREELKMWKDQTELLKGPQSGLDGLSRLMIPEIGRDIELETELEALNTEMNSRKQAAIQRGLDTKTLEFSSSP